MILSVQLTEDTIPEMRLRKDPIDIAILSVYSSIYVMMEDFEIENKTHSHQMLNEKMSAA